MRDYIHVTDLVAAHLAALDLLIAAPRESHVMNCGYGRGYSVLEVLGAVERLSGRYVARRMVARREGDPAALVADAGLIRARTGWQPRHDDPDTIVRDALHWQEILAGRCEAPDLYAYCAAPTAPNARIPAAPAGALAPVPAPLI